MDKPLLDRHTLSIEESAAKFSNWNANVFSPTSEEEVIKTVRAANEKGQKITLVSGGTKLGYGGVKSNYDLTLSLRELSGIVEHTVGDMTVTVKPGTSMKELQDYLRKHDQMVALDPSWPAQATIGGVVASNDSGPKRLKYGSARDHVIGMRIVYPNGKIIRTGGKVVKNVAGYDMNKLFVGSMGTLGVITEITLKLRPLPKCENLIMLTVREEALDDLLVFKKRIQDSMIEPVSLEILSPALSKRLFNEDGYSLLLALEDVEKSVAFQKRWVKENKPAGVVMSIISEAREMWNTISNFHPNSLSDRDHTTTRSVMKIGTKNLDVFSILSETTRIQHEGRISVEAHGGAGHGITTVSLKGDAEAVIETIQHLQTYAMSMKGYGIVKHLPFSLRHRVNVWGDKPSYFKLFEGIKQSNDPKNTLNEKRYIGGL
ncbi:FAD-binding oxidoreductase [Alkalihalobacillus sp. R86527]|uniref:FAD-binding oxidoreductase n=1 Tax=Alkalihalobacillus sp. R86527 TaxID=3093863 RepID=UPI00366D3C3F